MELVLKNLLKIFVVETEKKEDDIKKNKFLINELTKTIAEDSKTLVEFGMAPPIIAKIKSMIALDLSTINDNLKKEIINNVKDESLEPNPYARLKLEYPENAIFPPIGNKDDNNYENEFSTDDYYPNKVFLKLIIQDLFSIFITV